ncbi:MAG: hypothetical protein A2X05_00005 [Bacteroidetes bacterium GWE2_41_25]|nr:MAG: hypothetical protein A2X06_12445 [Bacteroidetes bacterium GWC2_40_22]OFY10801.1 MAG: hypothetical protein A2X05_00005 [Bacteroidetes bacterium GWE2_41_25]
MSKLHIIFCILDVKWLINDCATVPENKKGAIETAPLQIKNIVLFLFTYMILITVHKFINPSCSINKLHLTSTQL